MQSLTQTPDIGLCEGVDAFAKFCQVFKFNLMSYLFKKKFYTSNDRVQRETDSNIYIFLF